MGGNSVRSPSLAEFGARAVEAWMRGVFRARPGRVTKWDASKQLAEVQPLIQIPYLDEEDKRQVESATIVTAVPVIFPGAGICRITFPISDGSLSIEGTTIKATTGLLIWCDCSLDKWLTGKGAEVDPEFDHRDGHNDAVFIPGFNPFGAPLGDVPTDYISVGFDGGLQIKIEKSVVTVGEKDAVPTQFVALANLVKQNHDDIKMMIQTFLNAYLAHQHTWSGATEGGTTQPPLPAGLTNTYVVTDTAAKNLKAEQ